MVYFWTGFAPWEIFYYPAILKTGKRRNNRLFIGLNFIRIYYIDFFKNI
jgi:hypothetical protein